MPGFFHIYILTNNSRQPYTPFHVHISCRPRSFLSNFGHWSKGVQTLRYQESADRFSHHAEIHRDQSVGVQNHQFALLGTRTQNTHWLMSVLCQQLVIMHHEQCTACGVVHILLWTQCSLNTLKSEEVCLQTVLWLWASVAPALRSFPVASSSSSSSVYFNVTFPSAGSAMWQRSMAPRHLFPPTTLQSDGSTQIAVWTVSLWIKVSLDFIHGSPVIAQWIVQLTLHSGTDSLSFSPRVCIHSVI